MKLNKLFNGISFWIGIFAAATVAVLTKILIDSGVFSSLKNALFPDSSEQVSTSIDRKSVV